MATSKKRKNQLIKMADEAIHAIFGNGKISDSYNGQIAAFSVSVALSGLKPTMAIYCNNKSSAEVDRSKIIKLLEYMFKIEPESNVKTKGADLYNTVIEACGEEETKLKKAIVEYAIALKLAIRTFKLEKS